jgi:peptide chain release factor 1
MLLDERLDPKIVRRLDLMQEEHEDLARQLANPDIVKDLDTMRRVSKRHAELSETMELYDEFRSLSQQLAEARELLSDPDMKELARHEMDALSPRVEEIALQIREILMPRDPRDNKNVIVEVRAGAGGEEAALFAGELLRMYIRYAERMRWKVEPLSSNPTDLGGLREAAVSIKGKGAYSKLKYEMGVHRVQRVPSTESGGRIHTSTATVAVLPEAEEVELEIKSDELQIETFRSAGAGGQNVQKNETAVRITHLPTGTVASCQDERSQHQNKEKALRYLRAQLLERKIAEQEAAITETRRTQVGTGERNEKGRTYNFPQDRITDHRIHVNFHGIPRIMDGELDNLIQAHIAADDAGRLAS